MVAAAGSTRPANGASPAAGTGSSPGTGRPPVFRGKFLHALEQARRTRQIPNDPESSAGAWQRRHRAKRTLTLPIDTLIGRFLHHMLPRGFKRFRHYGLLAAHHKRARLSAARTALQTPEPQPLAIEAAEAFLVRVSGHDPCRCPHCASGRWRTIGVIAPTPRCRDGPS